MCTAISFSCSDHYFGRNLDFEYSYTETITITPRYFPLSFRHMSAIPKHFALIGMAYVQDNYPLYYDATNEHGLSMAGLLFPGNAYYEDSLSPRKDNIASFELIPWILSQCRNLTEAETLLSRLQLVNTPFSRELPPSPLHWMLTDSTHSLVIEAMEDGLHIHENPIGVLTNNPPFPYQQFSLNNYPALSPKQPQNSFSDRIPLSLYSRGMGALGLPGDLSSQSRFIRATFVKLNSVISDNEEENISQFFHILHSVEQQKGCVVVTETDTNSDSSTAYDNPYEYTIYSSCCNTTRGIYYYTTYENPQIAAVDLKHEDLDSTPLITYPMLRSLQIKQQNR